MTLTSEEGANALEARRLIHSTSDINADPLTIVDIRTGKESEIGTDGAVGVSLSGLFGDLVVQTDGSFNYNANDAAKNASETVYDFFTYTVFDGTYTDDATVILEII